MARAGLGPSWTCLFANDVDPKKGLTYQVNWGTGGELKIGDVAQLDVTDLPGVPDLVWGSFPCQDLSLAGSGAGLRGDRSGTFYPFWKLIEGLIADHRAPKLIALENVCGTLTSHSGKDFEAIAQTFADTDYRFGALVINAALFLPQSRPRLFMIGVRSDVELDPVLLVPGPIDPFHTRGLQSAVARLRSPLRETALWWNLPVPSRRATVFANMIEEEPTSVSWHTASETRRLLAMMSPINLAKVNAAKRAGHRVVGGIYKRTRPNEKGIKVQRAEVRFDDISGCLRTPGGGSSRQTIIVVDGNKIRSRLISARETARLMGLTEGYRLPRNYNEAYHLTGDGVAVPVVRHLTLHLLEQLIATQHEAEKVAA